MFKDFYISITPKGTELSLTFNENPNDLDYIIFENVFSFAVAEYDSDTDVLVPEKLVNSASLNDFVHMIKQGYNAPTVHLNTAVRPTGTTVTLAFVKAKNEEKLTVFAVQFETSNISVE